MLAHIADSIGDPREMSNPPDMLKEDDALVRGFESGLSSVGTGARWCSGLRELWSIVSSVLRNPAPVLKSDSELSRDLVSSRLGARLKPSPTDRCRGKSHTANYD